MNEGAKLLERMNGHNINSYDELCRCLRVHDAAFINDLGADVIESLIADLNNAIQYIPHTCQTCRYWELSEDPKHMYCCNHPNRENPCYVWRTQNWEWNGKPPEQNPYRIWKWK